MNHKMLAFAVASICPALAACSAPASNAGSGSQAVTGGRDETSSPDGQPCEIVLREAGRSFGEVFQDPTGSSWLVYRGLIDVDSSLLAPGVRVLVQYRVPGGDWITVEATPSTLPMQDGELPAAGFSRFAFATQTGTSESGQDWINPLEMIPYASFPLGGIGPQSDGHNLWDHNRTTENYQLNQDDGYQIVDDSSVCPSPAMQP